MAVGSCCAQIFWIKHQLEDYGIMISKIATKCDTLVLSIFQKIPSDILEPSMSTLDIILFVIMC